MVMAQVSPPLYRSYFKKQDARPSPQEFKEGQLVNLPGIEKGRVNVVVGMSPQCGFCRHDAEEGFYGMVRRQRPRMSW
jgi:hypothetical protein